MDEQTITRTPRILVADDMPVTRLLIKTALDRLGVVTDLASSGEDTISAMRAAEYQVLILDLRMSRGSGYDVLDELKKWPVRPVVIVITASPGGYEVDPEIVATVVRKPFDVTVVADLAATIARKAAEARPVLKFVPKAKG